MVLKMVGFLDLTRILPSVEILAVVFSDVILSSLYIVGAIFHQSVV